VKPRLKLVAPQININGTSHKELMQQQIDVLNAIDALYKAMGAATPHGRDYQLNPAEFEPARSAWFQRMADVATLRTQLQCHAVMIQTKERR
jgi:hypothetical protein